MSDYLSEELLEKIFIRLSVKVLLCCRTVCKKWYNLISNPMFFSEHLKFTKASNKNTQFFIEYSTTESDENFNQTLIKHYVIYHDKNIRQLEGIVRVDLQEPKGFRYSNAVGSCNGVVCIPVCYVSSEGVGYGEEVVLWNPSIRRSLRLPKSKLSLNLELGEGYTFGFGFDHVSNDYKVFRLYSRKGEHFVHEGFFQSITKVEMFRLSTGLWEDITSKVPFKGISNKSQAVLNGVVHWIGVDKGEVIIVTFDMHNEVFGIMKLPKNPENQDWAYLFDRYLIVFEEKLFLFRQLNTETIEDSADEEESDEEYNHYREVQYECWQFQMNFDVWRMEEYGVSESWTQLHSGTFNTSALPLGFRKNGDVLWAATTEGLISNKIGNNAFRILGECGDATFRPSGSSYTESLVLLDKTIPSTGSNDLVGILQD